MTPVVRIDDAVMNALKKLAIEMGLVFEPPNTTLRRVLGLDSQVSIEEEASLRKEEGVMSYFLTTHTPIPIEEDRNKYDNCIWINQDTPHWKEDIKRNDRIVVYEVKGSGTPGKVRIGGRPHTTYPLRWGLVSLVEITSDFIHEDDQVTFEDNLYLGKFQGAYISKIFVPRDDLNKAWKRAFEKFLNPRLRGGIRRLSIEEYQLIATLMRVEP